MKMLLLLLFVSFASFCQNDRAHQRVLSAEDSLPKPKAVYPIPNGVGEKYMAFRDSAQVAYRQNDFKKCVDFFYRATGQAYFIDGYLRYMAGVSCFRISQQSGDEAYKTKAKYLLIQANHEGYAKAEMFLKNNF